MTQHLALAADATVHSARTLRACVRLAQRMKTKRITLIQAVPEIVRPNPDANLERVNEECSELHTRMHDGVEKQLQQLGELVQGETPVEIDAQVVDGLPAKALPKAALEIGATALVVGSHGRHHGWLHKMLEVHVTPSIVRASRLPTLVLNAANAESSSGRESPSDRVMGEMSRILIAADREPGALDALQLGIDWAKRTEQNPRVTVLVKEPAREEIIAAIRAQYDNIEVVGFRPRGKRAQKILWLGAKMGAHMTVLSSDGPRRHRRYFSSFSGILNRTPEMPILIARATGLSLESLVTTEDAAPCFEPQAAIARG